MGRGNRDYLDKETVSWQEIGIGWVKNLRLGVMELWDFYTGEASMTGRRGWSFPTETKTLLMSMVLSYVGPDHCHMQERSAGEIRAGRTLPSLKCDQCPTHIGMISDMGTFIVFKELQHLSA